MKTIVHMMDHLYWADRQLYSALEERVRIPADALKLYSHLIVAERVWLLRLQGADSRLPLWPEEDLAAAVESAKRNESDYRGFIAGLTEEGLDRIVSYVNQKNKAYETSVRDILTHVALHGQYHRGQVNRALRLDGELPVAVDFIDYVRSGSAN